jgi:uncharacterized protein (DUF1684 family)
VNYLRKKWNVPVLAGVVLIALVAACDRATPGTMVSIRPPVLWTESLAAQRATKDEAFRTSPETPLLAEDVKSFTGLQYWQPDARYYYVGPINVDTHKEQFQIITTAGQARPCEKFGSVAFPIDGVLQRLQVYRLLDQGGGMRAEDLLLPFTDGTTGTETYPSGRYVDLKGPPGDMHIVAGPDGRPVAVGPYVLDFNQAYNPSCAYGAPERFACPVTPKANRLSMRIEAGERGFKLREGAEGG